MTKAEQSISERIVNALPTLSAQELRAAEFMRTHLADLAVYNSSELARMSGVSKATISRLYRRLGFAGADDVREHARALRASGTPVATGLAADLSAVAAREASNLELALSKLNVVPAAQLIASADRVIVVGFRNSYPFALHLRTQLAQARKNVTVAPSPGQSVGEELADLGATQTVILFGFRRRPEGFARLVATLERSSARVVLLADPSGRRFATSVDHFIECPIEINSAFDSYASVASVVSLVASAVMGLSAESAARVDAITTLYSELRELES